MKQCSTALPGACSQRVVQFLKVWPWRGLAAAGAKLEVVTSRAMSQQRKAARRGADAHNRFVTTTPRAAESTTVTVNQLSHAHKAG